MTNAAAIQAKLNRGYGRAATKLGSPYNLHRAAFPQYATDQSGNRITDQSGRWVELQNGRHIVDQTGQLVLDQLGRPVDSQPVSRVLTQDGGYILDQAGEPMDMQSAPVGQSPTAVAHYDTKLVSFNAEDMGYRKPNKYGRPTWYAVFDASNAEVGDYLIGPQGTFFIAAMQPLLPVLVVECNRVVSVFTPQDQSGDGAQQGYAGNTDANRTAIMTGWPASVLQGTKGERTDAKLPDDTRAPWWSILLPYLEGTVIEFGDVIEDDLGRSYQVSSAELSSAGWRITAQQNVS